MKTFTITCNEKQLGLLMNACEGMARLRCGQMYLGPLQDLLAEMWEKTKPEGCKATTSDMLDDLEIDMKSLQYKYFNRSPGGHYGIGFDSKADIFWDMYQVLRYAKFLSKPISKQEKKRWLTCSDKPMQFGSEPLMKVTHKETDPITSDYLERHGWAWKAPYWVLKSTPRIGWNPTTKEIVIGYAAIPVKVDSIGHLRSILLDFNIVGGV